jgi:hypothetical protein
VCPLGTAFEGFWLNLLRASERADAMHRQLQSLGVSAHYRRVDGVVGLAAAAAEHGLKAGEWGAWQGWLGLLEAASASPLSRVHLLEDDTEISPQFLALLAWPELEPLLASGYVIATDGYVSPQQAITILQRLQGRDVQQEPWLLIREGLPLPCLNSILLTPASAGRLLHCLRERLVAGAPLPPIDRALGDACDGWFTVAPFATGPLMEESLAGATREAHEAPLALSRYGLTLLRRCLMEPCDGLQLGEALAALMGDLPVGLPAQLVAALLQQLVEQGVVRPY